MINFIKSLLTTKLGWLYITLFCVLLFGILSNYYEWAIIAHFISWIYPVIFTLVAIVYGIINHIKGI